MNKREGAEEDLCESSLFPVPDKSHILVSSTGPAHPHVLGGEEIPTGRLL